MIQRNSKSKIIFNTYNLFISLFRIDKHSKFSRRRAFKHNDDVDYINERNMRFNKKAARYYDKYTVETKQNLERGTAI